MMKFTIPKEFKDRLKKMAALHGFASGDVFGSHLVEKGLAAYGETDLSSLDPAMTRVVDRQGYSSNEELIEHLLERGLKAYEDPVDDPAQLEERLRGLGYIE